MPPEKWPLVLCGPIVRRVEPGAVSVFVACSRPRTVRLSLFDGPGPDDADPLHVEVDRTRPLGRFLHAAVVTARPPVPLRAGRLVGYDLAFVPPDGGGGEDLGSLGLLGGPDGGLGYAEGARPGLVIPPDRPADIRIVHGSCRKPHAERRDALATLDKILRGTQRDPRRPQQLFLTGDQIYADDVEPAVLALAGQVGAAALEWDRPEDLPGVVADDFALAPSRRGPLVRRAAGFTGPVLDSHLLSLAEFVGMYLLVWSDELWPADGAGHRGPPPPGAVLDDPRWADPAHRRSHWSAVRRVATGRGDLAEFVRTLPLVRRALANVATYMILDDHDVTDDWNLHGQWVRTVHGKPLGRRVVQNALAAYAVFQGWGNDPARYAAGEPGGRLLSALERWRGEQDDTAEAIAAAVGLPSHDRSPRIAWDYAIDTPCYQAIVLDTRTRRGFGGTGRAAPALLDEAAREAQLTRRLRQRGREVPLTVVVSAAPVFGHPLVEVWLQLKKIKAIEWIPGGPAAVDREAWSLNPSAYEALLATLVSFRRVVILSGDVHYAFACSVGYRDLRGGRRARFVQLTASPLHNEELRSRLLGGVPTVARVPRALGTRVERLVTRVTTPLSVSWLGWPPSRRRWRRGTAPLVLARTLAGVPDRLGRPDWTYTVDFASWSGADPVTAGLDHQRARELRRQHSWQFMHSVVGRNNLGDVEFPVPAAADGGQLVRQSLWFDKTTIRSDGEPERLPYTMHELPLDPPEEE